jgi:hypothetical protein
LTDDSKPESNDPWQILAITCHDCTLEFISPLAPRCR